MPKLSIITINYNNKEGLEKTIKSVVNQTHKDIEYVVIDGGSTDGSKELIEQHKQSITYWVSERDKGIYHAMNKGIHAATGEYLLFLNSGDYLSSDNIISDIDSELVNEDIIYGNWIQYYNSGVTKEEVFPDTITFDFLAFRYTMPHQASFIKKSLMLEAGLYDERLKIKSDWKFFLVAIFKYRCSVKHINHFISYYNKDGLSFNDWFKQDSIQKKETRQILEEEYPGLPGYMEKKNDRISYFERHILIRILRRIHILK